MLKIWGLNRVGMTGSTVAVFSAVQFYCTEKTESYLKHWFSFYLGQCRALFFIEHGPAVKISAWGCGHDWRPASHFRGGLDQWIPFNYVRLNFPIYYFKLATSLFKSFLHSVHRSLFYLANFLFQMPPAGTLCSNHSRLCSFLKQFIPLLVYLLWDLFLDIFWCLFWMEYFLSYYLMGYYSCLGTCLHFLN